MRLFKRVRRGAAFAASAVNRRGQTVAGPAAAKQASAGNRGIVDEDTVCLETAACLSLKDLPLPVIQAAF